MAADIIGGLVRDFPYKRRRCRAVARVGSRFRWRVGNNIMVERGIIWNRHLSPMVGAAITTFTNATNADLGRFLDDHGIGDHASNNHNAKRCEAAPQNTTVVISSTAEPPAFDPTTIDLTEAGGDLADIIQQLQAGRGAGSN